jgi:alpha-tubulin suppressor-like RCC1 family protein
MLPTHDANQEYYEELRAMGYANEEAEERMQERGREYHGMIRMNCRRVPQSLPKLVPHLQDIRIVSVSAGYAHVMLVSDTGYLYASGYNDRGQLGLG